MPAPSILSHRATTRLAAYLLSACATMAPALAQDVDVSSLVNTGTNAVPACVTCHGAQGLGNADVGAPMIASMDAGYIVRVLTAYADGTRVGYTMNGIAAELSSDEIGALAAYYASLPVSRNDWQIDTASAEHGQAVATNGIMTAGVPSCVSCHGQTGSGIGATFPRISGQLPDYMAARIDLWTSGEDTADTPVEAIMARIATNAPPDEMSAAIAYFAGFDPAAAPSTGYTSFDTDWPRRPRAPNPFRTASTGPRWTRLMPRSRSALPNRRSTSMRRQTLRTYRSRRSAT